MRKTYFVSDQEVFTVGSKSWLLLLLLLQLLLQLHQQLQLLLQLLPDLMWNNIPRSKILSGNLLDEALCASAGSRSLLLFATKSGPSRARPAGCAGCRFVPQTQVAVCVIQGTLG